MDMNGLDHDKFLKTINDMNLAVIPLLQLNKQLKEILNITDKIEEEYSKLTALNGKLIEASNGADIDFDENDMANLFAVPLKLMNLMAQYNQKLTDFKMERD